jgi:hypothetical protein
MFVVGQYALAIRRPQVILLGALPAALAGLSLVVVRPGFSEAVLLMLGGALAAAVFMASALVGHHRGVA